MGYRLKPDRPLADEIRRVAARQLDCAAEELKVAAAQGQYDHVHIARKHVKKVRALLRLIRADVGPTYRHVNAQLRRISRQLGRVSDAAALVATVERLSGEHPDQISRSTAASILALARARERKLARKLANPRALRKSARRLRTESHHTRHWQIGADGFRAVEVGLTKVAGQARTAMRRARRHPTPKRFHAWRRRVKDQWLQMRVLEARCRPSVAALTRDLEALDGVLGADHDLALVRQTIEGNDRLSRTARAEMLGVIAGERRQRRSIAAAIGSRLYGEPPEAFVQQVATSWIQP